MRYDQYQQLYKAAQKQIEARVARLQPRAGNRASVNGMGISIEPIPTQPRDTTEPTWRFVLLGRAVGAFILNGESTDFDTGVVTAATVGRTGLILRTYFWENTALFNFDPDDADPFSRYFTLYLTSNSAKPGGPNLGFKFPTKVVIEMLKSLDDGVTYTEVVSEYNFFVRYSGDSRGFTAPSSDENFILRIKSIERL